jgi:branched-chain amino acid transport system substrate-binding protein
MRCPLRILVMSLVLSLIGFIPSAPAAPAPTVVKIAFLGPLTGPNAPQGLGARNAFDLALRQANNSGRFPFRIEGMVLDDASDPATGRAAALRAVSDPAVVAATGHWNSPVAFATIEVFHEHKTPIIIWGAIHPDITRRGYREVTRVAPTVEMETIAGVRWVVEGLKIRRWAVIHDTTTYGLSTRDAFVGAARGFGADILSTDGITVGERDFTALLTKVRGLNPSGVFFGGVVTEGALMRAQMVRLRAPGVFFSISGIFDDKFIEAASPTAAEGTLSIKPGLPVEKLPGGRKFIEEYRAAGYREPYGAYGPNAYDATMIILEALRQVGPDRLRLTDAIRGTTHNGLMGVTTFDREGQSRLVLTTNYVVQDGKWVVWDESEYGKGRRKLPSP